MYCIILYNIIVYCIVKMTCRKQLVIIIIIIIIVIIIIIEAKTKKIFEGEMAGKRPRGRPRMRWTDNFK